MDRSCDSFCSQLSAAWPYMNCKGLYNMYVLCYAGTVWSDQFKQKVKAQIKNLYMYFEIPQIFKNWFFSFSSSKCPLRAVKKASFLGISKYDRPLNYGRYAFSVFILWQSLVLIWTFYLNLSDLTVLAVQCVEMNSQRQF